MRISGLRLTSMLQNTSLFLRVLMPILVNDSLEGNVKLVGTAHAVDGAHQHLQCHTHTRAHTRGSYVRRAGVGSCRRVGDARTLAGQSRCRVVARRRRLRVACAVC